jgi:head-tail adaptor
MVAMPTDAQLAAAAARRNATMDKTVIIRRASKISDGAGGRLTIWANHQTVQGRLNGLGRSRIREEVIAGALQGRAGYMWTLPRDTDVTIQDRIIADDRAFEVLMVLERSHLTALRCVCVDVGDASQYASVLVDPAGGLVVDGAGGAITTL